MNPKNIKTAADLPANIKKALPDGGEELFVTALKQAIAQDPDAGAGEFYARAWDEVNDKYKKTSDGDWVKKEETSYRSRMEAFFAAPIAEGEEEEPDVTTTVQTLSIEGFMEKFLGVRVEGDDVHIMDEDELEEGGNPYHSAEDGKFTSGDAINRRNAGSWSLDGEKKKLKKGKKGQAPKKSNAPDPCGRDARSKGGDVRCWDGAIKSRVPKG